VSKTYLILGGTGLVGRALTREFLKKGHQVKVLSRSDKHQNSQGLSFYSYDAKKLEFDYSILQGVDVVIHTAGEPIFERSWKNEQVREELLTSRANLLRMLIKACEKTGFVIPQLTLASAVGYYGYHDDNPKRFDEDSRLMGSDLNFFPAKIIRLFERTAKNIEQHTNCLTVLRLGIVLSRDGGYYAKLRPSIKWYAGSLLGDGISHIPFIHIDDLVRLFEFTQGKPGIFNAVCPEDLSNKKFNFLLNKYLNRYPIIPQINSVFIRLIFGEKSCLLLFGQSVEPKRTLEAGFEFLYPDLESCVKQLEAPDQQQKGKVQASK